MKQIMKITAISAAIAFALDLLARVGRFLLYNLRL